MKGNCIIIGGGIAGLSAALYLSDALPEAEVMLCDQAEIPNPKGSSYGASRMYREMYSDPFYANLMKDSLELWHDIERRANVTLLNKGGLLFFGSSDIGETVEGSIDGAEKTMQELGISYKKLATSQAIKADHPGIEPGENDTGLFSNADGEIHATNACIAIRSLAEKNGVSVHENTAVKKILSCNDNQYRVVFENGKETLADNIVVATGAWTKENVKQWFDVDLDLEIHSVVWGYYHIDDSLKSLPQWFCFRDKMHTQAYPECHGLYYGFPIESDSAAGIRKLKVGTDFTPKSAHHRPRTMSEFDYTADSRISDDISAFLKVHLPLARSAITLESSPYNMTHDNQFVLDNLKNFPGVSLFCGGNGRAFKFGPSIGKAISELVRHQKTSFDINRFNLERIMQNQTSQTGHLGTVHVPWNSDGTGKYSLATQGCFDVIERAYTTVNAALNSMLSLKESKNDLTPLLYCDYGAADGGTSIPLWRRVLNSTHERFPSRQMHLVYEDQPNNDWKSLFYYTQDRLQVPGRLDKDAFISPELKDNVFITASGTSFHDQCLPSNSVDFGFSATAMHWLSNKPATLPSDAIHHTQIDESNSAHQAYAQQAARDWENILLKRAAEMKVGASMVIVNFCRTKEGYCLGNTPSVPNKMFDVMREIWRTMASEGLITENEFSNTSFMNYYRSEEEMLSPFTDAASAVYQAGLRCASHEIIFTPCPYHQNWMQSDKTDPKSYARFFLPTMRTWSNSTFETALDSEKRSDEERKSIVDLFFSRFEDAITADPDHYAMDYVHMVMAINKK